MRQLLVVIVLALFGWACGDTDDRAPLGGSSGRGGSAPVPMAGSSGRAGSGPGEAGAGGDAGGGEGEGGAAGAPMAGAAGEGGSGNPAVGAPEIEILSPAAVDDPAQEGVLVERQVQVLCRVTRSEEPGAKPVDPSSVSIQLLDAAGRVLRDSPGVAATEPGVFTSTFVTTSVPSGPLSFRCKAGDTSEPSLVNATEVRTFVDHGPVIDIGTPEPEAPRSLAGAVRFDFAVTPVPLADPDPQSALSAVTLQVNGVDIEVEQSTDGVYFTTVDFQDERLFPDAPFGDIPVVIRASNERGAQSSVTYSFVLDAFGPKIAFVSPQADSIIGGRDVRLEFSVEDEDSAVAPETISVELNTESFRFPDEGQWPVQESPYVFRFDATQVLGSRWQVTVNVSAQDEVGNIGFASRNFYLDTTPPLVDLDPPSVREVTREGVCSAEFDVLGTAADDLSIQRRAALFRAFVWDLHNEAGAGEIAHPSLSDQSSVFLHIQADSSRPLLTDSDDADALCDAIDARTTRYQNLSAIDNAGVALYPTAPALEVVGCSFNTSANVPKRLCDESSDLVRIVDHAVAGPEPVIYGVGALRSLECTGAFWEIQPLVKREGWVCLAAVAADKVGNSAVSPPLRICLDDGIAPHPDCSLNLAPSCTDGCTVKTPPMPPRIRREL